jgi:hypothetical protein
MLENATRICGAKFGVMFYYQDGTLRPAAELNVPRAFSEFIRQRKHVAGVEDYQVALATFRAACERWPGTPTTLRQGARVIEDSRRLRVVRRTH